MRETQRQIEKYKAQLPHMRERVAAALVLLIMAAVMMVSSTFAWIVLSANPEVKGMNTTITSNGSLEIALASGTAITQPNDSEVGDSGKDLAVKNTTWGNLINLGDPIYGLENIVLRPATLNTNSLLESPLYAAGYGTDGRVDTLESDFAYAAWDKATETFLAQNVQYGVRTVASVVYEDAGKDLVLAPRVSSAETKIASAKTDLQRIANADQIDDLGALMQQYVQEMVNQRTGSSASVIKIDPEHMESIYELMVMLKGNMELIADALAESYNIQLIRHTTVSHYEENKFTGEELLTANMTAIDAKMNANVSGETAVVPANKTWLTYLRSQYNGLKSDIAKVEALLGRTDVIWENLDGTAEEDKKPELYPIVNNVVHISSAKIDGTPLSSLGKDAILGLLGKQDVTVEAQSGYLKDADQLSGACVKSKQISLSVKYLITKTVKGTVTTYASNPNNTTKFAITEEFNKALSGATNYKGTNPVAKDTFGMSIDFFVRTNAANSHLILQGSPVYEEREEFVSATIDGVNYDLYTVVIDETEYTAYLKDGAYYTYDREYGVAGTQLGTTEDITNPPLLKESVRYIVGYNGVNRVWDESESALLGSDSTTQGAGSCYVFYPATPEDQEKSLQLLKHFRIAFVDQSGKLLATALMDVEHCFAETGKVTVPLVLSDTGNSITGSDGNPIYTITELTQNEATFISALVYLDGVGLTNDQVLAAGEIQGQLNLQFGSSADLDAMDDPVLMESKCRVTAVMEGAPSVAFDTATADQLKKTIIATVDGYTPTKVEAYFLREINSTQGVRQGKMTFQKNAEGKWVGEHTFTAPGKYILREIFLDGVSYELDQDPIVFTVEGFTITDLYCQDNGKTYMKTDKSFETSVSLTFAGDDVTKMPQTVKGAFIHQETGNRTTVYFTRGTGSTWVGSATFTTSGEYRMEYLELDGQYTGLVEPNHISINLYLGLSASVYADHTNFALESGESRDINMSLIIKDDSGERIGNLSNVWLYYAKDGSNLTENGLSAPMAWNATGQSYQGTFHVDKAGKYHYNYVAIDLQGATSTLNVAVVAPEIAAKSTKPVKYISKDGFGETFALNGSAGFTVRLTNADAATVDAVLKNEEEETYYVRCVADKTVDDGTEQVFYFPIPVVNGSQQGTWTLEGIYLTDVYGGKDNASYEASNANGPDTATEKKPLYTVEDNYYVRWLHWDIEDITNDTDEVEPVLHVLDTLDLAIDSTDTTTDYNGTFGKTHQFDGFNMSVKVHGGQSTALEDYGLEVAGLKVVYTYDASCVGDPKDGMITNDYGGYSIANDQWRGLVNNTANVTVEFHKTGGSGENHTLTTTNKQAWLAGQYKMKSAELILSQNGEEGEYTVPASFYSTGHIYTITSTKPSVSIAEIYYPTVSDNTNAITIKTSGTVTADTSGSGNTGETANGHKNVTASISNGVTAVAPLRCTNGEYGLFSKKWYHGYAPPRITLSLSNLGVGTDATLDFNSNTNIYTGFSSNVSSLWREYSVSGGGTAFSWTSAKTTCDRFIGSGTATIGRATETVSGKGEKTPAGTITASVLKVSYGDATYNFTLDKTITIKQEY